MGADLSRVRFDALRDHAGVVLQQGRLLLDADWNELVAIVERRLRAGVADLDSNGPVTGIAGVAVVPRTTPDGFKVTLTAGKLAIGRGRMYVDGLLAENHGTGNLQWDALLSEQQHKLDTPYEEQPYGPAPTLPTTGSHLAYLDVWQRDVTSVEAPDLVDSAIGVDTTARTQTVWQVRVHELTKAGVTCATLDADIPGWAGMIAPTPSRLTVTTDPTTVTSDPCDLPPTGGYRGRENQTYRVEIHDGGAAGTATFKWSRDNGSVVSPALEVLPDGLTLLPASLGKDIVLGFDTGQWVEVLDDHRELSRTPGDIRKVDDIVNDALVFTTPLSADLRLGTGDAADRHLRVRRWDQNGRVKTSTGTTVVDLNDPSQVGAITVPTGASTRIVLENGVTVSFTANGGSFRSGDHWVFAARVADNSVEEVVEAPPLGIHHHYARLGVLTFPDGETDCRTAWPPDCQCNEGACSDCTACVTPESHASGSLTIQVAVDNVSKTGGTVCLAAGSYHLDWGGVVISDTSSITIRGQGPRTLLLAQHQGIIMQNSAFVTLEDFAVVVSGARPCVVLDATIATTVQRLELVVLPSAARPAPAVEVGGVSLRTRLLDNVVVSTVGITGGGDEKTPLLTAELLVRDNVLACRDLGIGLDGRVAHILGNHITGNTVLFSRDVGMRLRGTVGKDQGFDVVDNTVTVAGGGIEIGPSGYSVRDNHVTGTPASVEGRARGITVVVGSLGGDYGATTVSGNQVRDVGGVGIGVLAPVESLDVSHNQVERALHGIVFAERARASSVTISHNLVTDVGCRDSDKADGAVGIQVVGADVAHVESNIVHGVGAAEAAGDSSVGVRVLACLEVRVSGCSVDRVGLPSAARGDLGIAVMGLPERVQVTTNVGRRQPPSVKQGDPRPWVAVLVGMPDRETVLTKAGEYLVVVEDATIVLNTLAAFVTLSVRPAATIDANIADGSPTSEPAILVGYRGDVIATGNQCHKQTDGETSPALLIRSNTVTASNNRCMGGQPFAMSLEVKPDQLAAVGNVVSSEVIGAPMSASGTLEDPWRPINVYNS